MKYGDGRLAALRYTAIGLVWLCMIAVSASPCCAARGAYEVPDSAYASPVVYYNTASGTGNTLKVNLQAIISTGFKARNYGDARYADAILDQDPSNPSNIILAYNAVSVPKGWDSGTTWNREHQWPKSFLNLTSAQVDNAYKGVASDLFELRPANPSVNTSRSNLGYGGTSNGSGTGYGISGSYWYPGDIDAGEVARSMFYMATLYSNGYKDAAGTAYSLNLINGTPSTYNLGDLASLLKWHYQHGVDNFERRRNQYIYSSALNPNYYQGNRNPFIDHPEYVWAIFGGGNNNSQIYVGSTPNADGSSSSTISLGRVMLGGTLGSSSVTMNKIGVNPTTFDITTSGAGSCVQAGVGQGIDYNTQSQSLSVSLASSAASATGLKSGTITIHNSDLTSSGAGHGSSDSDDSISISASVLGKRVIAPSTNSVYFQRVMVGTPISSNFTLSTTGDDNSYTRVNVPGSVAADGNGISISGENMLFDSAMAADYRAIGGTFASTGVKSGTFSLAVTTAENGGAGLTGEGSYASLSLSYSATALTQRLVTANSNRLNFNRVMVGATVSGSVTLSTAGDDNNRTRINVVGNVAADGNGIGVSGTDTLFNSASTTASRTISGSFSNPGITSGRLAMSVTTAENSGAGLNEESPYSNLYIWYMGTALTNRLVTSTSANFGSVHVGAVLSTPITLSTASGDDNHATRVRVSNAGPDAYGIGVSGGSNALFNDNSVTDLRTIGGTASQPGPFSGTITLTTSGEGLAGEVPQNVAVAYTAQVYSGMAVMNSPSGGSWATPATWKDAVTASTTAPGPGLAGYAGDTATLGNVAGSTTTTVTLDGVAPHLSSLTFSDTAGGYTIAPGVASRFQHLDVGVRGPLAAGLGGALTLGTGSGANIHLAGGSNLIAVPLVLDEDLTVDGAGSLTIAANIFGSERSLTKNGSGLLILTGQNSFDGGTFVNSGILVLGDNGALADGSSLSIGSGATLVFGVDISSYRTSQASAVAVPEPGTWSLLAGIAIGFAALNRNRKPRPATCCPSIQAFSINKYINT